MANESGSGCTHLQSKHSEGRGRRIPSETLSQKHTNYNNNKHTNVRIIEHQGADLPWLPVVWHGKFQPVDIGTMAWACAESAQPAWVSKAEQSWDQGQEVEGKRERRSFRVCLEGTFPRTLLGSVTKVCHLPSDPG